MSSQMARAGILYDGRFYRIPQAEEFDDVMVDSSYFTDPTVADVYVPQGPAEVDPCPYGPKPGGYTRIHTIESSGSHCCTRAHRKCTFVFVQGKDSACIVSHDSVKDKVPGIRLQSVFVGYADPRMYNSAVRRAWKENGDIVPYGVVSVSRNSDYLNEENGFEPDSSCKDPGSRCVNEEASINLLKQKLENGTSNVTIKDPGSGFVIEGASINILKQKLGNGTINETIQDPGSRFIDEEAATNCLKQKLKNGTINETIQDPGSRSIDEDAATNCLKQKLKNGTINETIQTAISALQCLYGQNFKAYEIEVYAFQDNKEYLLAKEEIESHLTIINNV